MQLRVIPYLGSDPSTGDSVLKGETLSVFVQQSDADLTALRDRSDRLIALVKETFPELGENYSVRVNARLPTGSTVADLSPELSEACGDRNLVQSGVKLAEFEPESQDDLFQFLCDGAQVVNPFFIEQDWDHLPGAWRTTDEP